MTFEPGLRWTNKLPDSICVIPPGHDARVVGEEPAAITDIQVIIK
jgi:hypothetical protein